MKSRNELDRNHLHLIVNQIGGTMPEKLGGMNKASKIVRTAQKLENLEMSFMNQARKANRAENQRNDRRAKR